MKFTGPARPLTLPILAILAAALSLKAEPSPAASGKNALPAMNYTASRYETLWTKSPFAVETAEVNAASSPDYMLVGIATIGNVSYASVIEREHQEHFLISSDDTTRGLKLLTVKTGQNGGDTFATVQKNGQTLTLKLERAAPGAPPVVANNSPPMVPQIQMPSAGQAPGAPNPAAARPFPRVRRSAIKLPPQNVPPPPAAP